jgi:hypothetical protein
MNDAGFVRGCERVGNLDRDVEDVAEFHCVASDALPQRHAFDVLHRDEWTAVVGFTDLMDHADIRMAKS